MLLLLVTYGPGVQQKVFLAIRGRQELRIASGACIKVQNGNWWTKSGKTSRLSIRRVREIGDFFYGSSVERTVEDAEVENCPGWLRQIPGEGDGHLYKIAADGNLISEVRVGEGRVYHPGWD